jgi:hypothetical protein
MLPTTRTKGKKINDKLNSNLFMHTQSSSITAQVVLTSLARGAWKKSYNGGTGRQGTR